MSGLPIFPDLVLFCLVMYLAGRGMADLIEHRRFMREMREIEAELDRMDAAMADEWELREAMERADEAGRFPWESP